MEIFLSITSILLVMKLRYLGTFKKTSKKIYYKHGSRKNTQNQRRRQKEMKLPKSEQLTLF